jgi:Tfp pilus assembly protein PilV
MVTHPFRGATTRPTSIPRRRTRQRVVRGVILVDAIVGAVILGVALVAIIGLSGRALSSQLRGQELQVAAMLLDEQLGLVAMRGADSYASAFPAEGQCDAPYQDYRFKLQFSGGSGGDAYRVRATVTWTSGGRARSESAETMIAPRTEEDPVRRPDEPINRYE